MRGFQPKARMDDRQLFGSQRGATISSRLGQLGITSVELERTLLPQSGRDFLERLVHLQLVTPLAARQFVEQCASRLPAYDSPGALGEALIQSGLLTPYQLDRIQAGTTHGLILGNYKVLERLGAGCMGVVFLAEHFLMKRQVAVKVLPVDDDCPQSLLDRFYSEIRVLAELHHPNIAMAFDAGELVTTASRTPPLLYLVMELVDGGDLDQHLVQHGLPSVAQACDWVRQAACGLQQAHDHHLIHRDIKPSNLLLTRQGVVKVVDFGLVRQFSSRMTSPRVLLGSVEFMAPEQSRDPTAVGAQADIYALGATLFWLLTGDLPFPPAKSLAAALRSLQQDPPRRVRSLRPEVPEELDALIDRMLDRDPMRRPALPVAVMNALTPFATPGAHSWTLHLGESNGAGGRSGERSLPDPSQANPVRPVLIVDRDPAIRQAIVAALEPFGCQCDAVSEGGVARERVQEGIYELVLLDLDQPDQDGLELCRQLRECPSPRNLRILALSSRGNAEMMSQALSLGADDLIAKPFDPAQLAAKVQTTLQIKDALDRYDQLTRHLFSTNSQLEQSLEARAGDVRQAQDALLFAMARMTECRDGESAGHARRLRNYACCLAEGAVHDPYWAGIVNQPFLEQLRRCVPLHDIGKTALPDQVLLKPGPLNPVERAQMEKHTILGAEILDALGRAYGDSLDFLSMALDIVRHHHERYDGRGYPDHLAGDNIPSSARLVRLADVYDALRRQRCHKSAMSHEDATSWILHSSRGHFDPALVQAFATHHAEFERIFRDIPG